MLAEAQSTWSANIIFRLADYYYDSVMSYLVMKKADLYSSVKVDINDTDLNTPLRWSVFVVRRFHCKNPAFHDMCVKCMPVTSRYRIDKTQTRPYL